MGVKLSQVWRHPQGPSPTTTLAVVRVAVTTHGVLLHWCVCLFSAHVVSHSTSAAISSIVPHRFIGILSVMYLT
jgi:hypothetical protein